MVTRRSLLGSIGVGTTLFAGCTEGSQESDTTTTKRQDNDNSPAEEQPTEDSPEVGRYGLPHCESGEYAFEILEIEPESSTEYANIVAKNLTNENLEIFSVTVVHNGNEYFVEESFQPRETKTVVLEGNADFAPDSDFELDVNGLDGEFHGMKCSTGSPSESEADLENEETTRPKPEYEANSPQAARDSSINFDYYSDMENYDGKEYFGGGDVKEVAVLTMNTPDYLLSTNTNVEFSGGNGCGSRDVETSYWFRGRHRGVREIESGDKILLFTDNSDCTLSSGQISVTWSGESVSDSILLGEFEVP